MNELDKLVDVGVLPAKKVKPFKDWATSSHKDIEIELRLLDVGENLEIMEVLGNDPILVQAIKAKIETLARALESVNGNSPCTPQDLERYNRENQTNLTFLEYKRNIISRWDLAVLNRLDEEYRELFDDQTELLTGTRPERKSNELFAPQLPAEGVPEPGSS